MSFNEAKITRVLYQNLLKLTVWHNALTDTPEPGTYTVIVNQYYATDTAWIRNGYRYDGENWRTPKGKITAAPVLAWYQEVD